MSTVGSRQRAVGSKQNHAASPRALAYCLLPTAYCLLMLCGCQQQMADQPSYKPLDASEIFPDGASARPLPPGTVAHGHLHEDVAMWTGRKAATGGEQEYASGVVQSDLKATLQPSGSAANAPSSIDDKKRYAQFTDEFPFPIDEALVEHGYHRYMIYCVVCHDPLGTGNGNIVQRGYTKPPSYHIDRLRKAPVGYLFAVVSEGYGSMPSYSQQIPMRDRWAIVAYLKALQASQHHPEETGGAKP